MSAGLTMVLAGLFSQQIFWIWSSGVVINTLKFSWMKRTCDVSKVFLQIESLQVGKYRKESFWSIIRRRYTWPKFTVHCNSHRCSASHMFLGNANVIFCPQKNNTLYKCASPHHDMLCNGTRNLWIAREALVPLSYQCVPFWKQSRICVIFRGNWLSIKFCENDSFRKMFL